MASKTRKPKTAASIKIDRKAFDRFVKMTPKSGVASSPRSPEGDSLNPCVLCFNDIELYAVGECDHALCHKCFVRLRVLCNDDQCPVCRNSLPKVVLSAELKPFSSFHLLDRTYDKKLMAYCTSDSVRHSSRSLLNHNCPICLCTFTQFGLLRDHARKAHERFYCDLCVNQLTLFSHEKKLYSRAELARHKRVGDADDTSHRGHPLCRFCDERYFDNDDLLVHLRRDHFFCHLCDKDGRQEYYVDYNDLIRHCRVEHFVCEQGECVGEKFTNIFRSELDLQAHEMKVHRKGKSGKILPVEVNYIRGRESVITMQDYEDVYQTTPSRNAAGYHQPSQQNSKLNKLVMEDGQIEPEAKEKLREATAVGYDAPKPQRKSKGKHHQKGRDKKQTVELNQTQQLKVHPPPGFGDLPPLSAKEKAIILAEEEFPTLSETSADPPSDVSWWKSRASLQDDFPALTDSNPLSQKNSEVVTPLGLSNLGKTLSCPPPGLIAAPPQRPPPGLGQSALVLAATASSQPVSRNETLAASILETLGYDTDKFSHFRILSAQFRKGQLSSDDYCDECIALAGKTGFDKIFPELVASLPDREKQKELMRSKRKPFKTTPHTGWSKNGGSNLKGSRYAEEFPALSAHAV